MPLPRAPPPTPRSFIIRRYVPEVARAWPAEDGSGGDEERSPTEVGGRDEKREGGGRKERGGEKGEGAGCLAGSGGCRGAACRLQRMGTCARGPQQSLRTQACSRRTAVTARVRAAGAGLVDRAGEARGTGEAQGAGRDGH